MDFRLFTHNEEVFMNIRQSFNRALLGAVCGALLLVSPASAAENSAICSVLPALCDNPATVKITKVMISEGTVVINI